MNDRRTGKGKQRADLLLVERGFVESRARAQALILAGKVLHGTQRIQKPGDVLPVGAELSVSEPERYVSRGGHKLEGALTVFELDPSGWVCVDVGASTGGFTDCLLQHGAAKVHAVDVGQGLLADRLRSDARVVVRDRTNARHLTAGDFDDVIDLVVADASFIGIDKLVPAFAAMLGSGKLLLSMVKPQFEAGREQARKAKGVISDPKVRADAIEQARNSIALGGFELLGGCDSSLPGPKGNVEYFVLARRTRSASEHEHPDVVQRVGPDGGSEAAEGVDEGEHQAAHPAENE